MEEGLRENDTAGLSLSSVKRNEGMSSGPGYGIEKDIYYETHKWGGRRLHSPSDSGILEQGGSTWGIEVSQTTPLLTSIN